MAEAAAIAPSGESIEPRAGTRAFVLRRLHSLTGLLPVGAFVLFHLFENWKALAGPAAYDEGVRQINAMMPAPYFYGLELAGVLGPIAFHAGYGLWIITTGEANTRLYPYASNRLYRLQRWSGVVAFFFILFHVLSLRVGVTLMGHLVTYRDVVNHLAPTPVLFFYLLGVLATLFHLCNGLLGFAWSWGLVESEQSRVALQRAAWVLFAVLAVPTVNLLLFLHQ